MVYCALVQVPSSTESKNTPKPVRVLKCYRGEPGVLQLRVPMLIVRLNKESCQTMMERAMRMIVSVVPPEAHFKVERTQ